ncbi:MAG: hypothetical protein U9R32_02050 [Bacteroidota bacterium]|nr:hypothetical protein [Bacteroidota bacterium]
MRLAFILLIAFQQCQGQIPKGSIDYNDASSILYHYVQDSLSDYNFIEKFDVNSNTYCLQKIKEQSFCCISDFNGDAVNDYALLLRDDNNKVCLFFFSIVNNKVEHYLIDCFGIWEGEITELKIAIEPKGNWEAIDETVKVPFDGIIVDDLRESKSKAYYWNRGGFVKFLYD